MPKTAQIIYKSCNRRDLELNQVKNFLNGNGYEVQEVEARQFLELQEDQISKNADLILFSTCAFSSVTEDSSIRDLAVVQRNKKNGAQILVCGCLPGINPGRLSQIFSGPQFGPRSYDVLNEVVRPARPYETFGHDNETRTYGKDTFVIQIHEGCPRNCSYCAIKLSVGKLRSMPLDDIIVEFHKGLAKGFKKFLLLGDCSGGYGVDLNESFGDLLIRIAAIEGDFSVSLTDIACFYLHSCFEAIKLLTIQNRLPYLYVATQSANPRILQLMRRSADMTDVKNMLIELRSINPVLELITSIIVGFPSETMEELNDTIEFCQAVAFSQVFCHGYSARPGVESTTLSGQLPAHEIEERCALAKARLGSMISIMTIPGSGAFMA